MNKLASQIESLLFVASKPLKLKNLAKLLDKGDEDIKNALEEIKELRNNSGVVLLEASEGYQLATNSDNSTIVKNYLNSDLREKLTEAVVEVLAIIAYRPQISKSEIEAIRGVNSQYSLRTLLMRGLIEKIPNPHDARGYLYQTTTEFLQHMGIKSINELPEFEEVIKNIKLPEVVSNKDNKENESETVENNSLE